MSIAITVAFVPYRHDYSNSLLFGTASYNINKLQHVQNLAARLALNNWHSSSKCLLDKLHWLPFHSRIQFKIATLTYKALAHNQPSYLGSLLTPYISLRALRSRDKSLLSVPCTNTVIGQRAFSYSAPTIWNSIPLNIRQFTIHRVFDKTVKTHKNSFLYRPINP